MLDVVVVGVLLVGVSTGFGVEHPASISAAENAAIVIAAENLVIDSKLLLQISHASCS
jgi:hypothetical protein